MTPYDDCKEPCLGGCGAMICNRSRLCIRCRKRECLECKKTFSAQNATERRCANCKRDRNIIARRAGE